MLGGSDPCRWRSKATSAAHVTLSASLLLASFGCNAVLDIRGGKHRVGVGGAGGSGGATAGYGGAGGTGGTAAAGGGGVGGVKSVHAYQNQSCALMHDKTLRCWGRNNYGQLGDGTQVDSNTPVVVKDWASIADVGIGQFATCVVKEGGGVSCVGQIASTNYAQSTPIDVTNATAITLGGSHICTLHADGTITCWHSDKYGQLGDGGGTSDDSVPVTVANLTTVSDVTAGAQHTCARTLAGEMYCWGYNSAEQLGNNMGDSTVPVVVAGLSDVKAVATGHLSSCALTEAGLVHCWGHNYSSTPPIAWAGLSGISKIASGRRHTCAIGAGGTLECCCKNKYGQLGDGSVGDVSAPVLAALPPVVDVAAGDFHTCALTNAGEVYCWGLNDYGQLGEGSNLDRPLPTKVLGL